MKTLPSAIGIALAATSLALGQPEIDPATLVIGGNANTGYAETSIAASPIDPNEVMLAAIMHSTEATPNVSVYYAINQNGCQSFDIDSGHGIFYPPSESCYVHGVGYGFADPGIAISATGDLLLSAVFFGGLGGETAIYVSRRPAGTLNLNPPNTVTCQSLATGHDDKCLMAMGSGPGGGPEQLRAVWARASDGACTGFDRRLLGAASLGDFAPATPRLDFRVSTTPTTPCDILGQGPYPAVIKGGPSIGRTVVAYLPRGTSSASEHEVPRVVYSDNLNLWLPFQSTIELNYSLASGVPRIESPEGAQPGVVAPNFPSIATDPTDATRVFVTFIGKTVGEQGESDIFLAMLENSGSTFSPNLLGLRRLRYADLLDPADPPSEPNPFQKNIEFFPTIAVDQWGGINIVFYRYVPGNPSLYYAYYARLDSFGQTTPIFCRRLTPNGFSALANMPVRNEPFLGDYIGITVSGCNVYACYTAYATTAGGSGYGLFVNRIRLCSKADASDDGFVNAQDLGAFAQAFAAAAPRADVNRDSHVNSADIEVFFNAFTCGCVSPGP